MFVFVLCLTELLEVWHYNLIPTMENALPLFLQVLSLLSFLSGTQLHIY